MKAYRHIAWFFLLFIGALAFLIVANLGKPSDKLPGEDFYLQKTAEVTNFLNTLMAEGENLLDSIADANNFNEASRGKWQVYRYNGSNLTHWSSNEWMPDSASRSVDGSSLSFHSSGWELVINNTTKGVLIAHPLARVGQGSFDALNNISPLNNIGYELVSTATNYSLWNDEAFISFFGNFSSPSKSGLWYLLAQLLLIASFFLAYYAWRAGTLIVVISSITLRYLSKIDVLYSGLSGMDLFNPTIFASSQWLPSLGDLVLVLVLVGMIFFTIKRHFPSITLSSKWYVFVYLFAICISAFFLADLIHSLIGSLVMNSNISFDVTNLSSISIYTFIAASSMFAMLWLFYSLFNWLLQNHRPSTSNERKVFAIIAILAIAGFIIFQHIDAGRSFAGLLHSNIFALLTLILLCLQFQRGKLYRDLAFLAIASFFFAEGIYQNQLKRESEYLDHYAAKLISSKDLEAEYLFRDIENSLAEEFLQPEDFQSFANKKEIFEKRLRRLYFSGYLDRYNLLVMSFDSAGGNINSSTRYNFEDLNNLYNYQAFPTLSNHFYQVKSTDIFNGYLAKFENCDLTGHYGNIFILLEPKFIQSSYEYPQLVQKKKEGRIINLENYSYAVYSKDRLMHQKGSFSYDLSFDSSRLSRQGLVGQSSRFYHFISRQNDQSIIVLSQPDRRLVAALSTFSYSFITFALLVIIWGAIWWGTLFMREQYMRLTTAPDTYQNYRFQRLKNLRNLGLEQVLLSTRIRVSMVALVLVGLLISVYVTIQFIRINDKRRSESELMYKIREVANQIQNEVDISRKLTDPEARQLIVNEIGDVFKVEVSLFDARGYLLASSVEDLYKMGIQAPLMEPYALAKLRRDLSSQILQTENIRNVKFTAAYIPLFDDNRRVIAYLNLPYFSQQNELDQEISTYTATFVNLYLFLMILAFFLAFVVSQRISKPLKIIREKMSTTGFGSSNELIEWRRNDEIGRLVQQYNKMVMQLEESAEKLSASEREGAWKEMARQVAHEIKNPLTPMKLNIQHLQRAWSDNSDKMEETFNRVTAILIEQINGLSRLAGEFSNFANMPVDTFEVCNVTESLLNTIVLFEKTENVYFKYESEMPEINIFADKNQLNRIFGNILKNAIQAIPTDRKGKIEVKISETEDEVTVLITDNGKGIAENVRGRIFAPNFSTKNSGMGLGLAMTRKMIEAAGGRISFETELKKGTTFSLTWPKHKEVR